MATLIQSSHGKGTEYQIDIWVLLLPLPGWETFGKLLNLSELVLIYKMGGGEGQNFPHMQREEVEVGHLFHTARHNQETKLGWSVSTF